MTSHCADLFSNVSITHSNFPNWLTHIRHMLYMEIFGISENTCSFVVDSYKNSKEFSCNISSLSVSWHTLNHAHRREISLPHHEHLWLPCHLSTLLRLASFCLPLAFVGLFCGKKPHTPLTWRSPRWNHT